MQNRKHTSPLQWPKRTGHKISVTLPDGTDYVLEPLQASLMAQAWAEAIAGAYVWERTKLPGTD